MIAAAGLAAGAALFVAAGLAWTARLLRIGALDALELAQKVGVPEPNSALDWPELRVVAAVAPDIPDDSHEALVLVDWPAYPERMSTLLVELVQDVFFRIGGATPGEATTSLVVNSSHVILDDVWAWRADHGNGVGWTDNTADTGVIVNGNNVIAYGLFVEHYQKYQVIWNGQDGTDIFFQNEMPYDPPSQAAWMSSPTTDGYAAFLVGPRVTTFTGYGLGSYCFFDQGIAIEASQAFQVPDTPGVQLNDILTRFLNGSGGIESVVNGMGAAVDEASPGPTYVAAYP